VTTLWHRAAPLLCCIGSVAACDGPPADPIAPDDPLPLRSIHEYSVYPSERQSVEIARRVPGFGGYFIDDNGNIIAYLTDPAREDALRPLLQPVLHATMGSRVAAAGAQILVRPGVYDFLQLRGWRDRLTDPVLSTPGVAFLDLDERANRVVIGVHDDAARMTLEQVIETAFVPRDAVLVRSAGRNVFDSGPTLRDLVRPVAGGLQNNFVTGNGEVPLIPCTIGFNADWNGQLVWLTNSHCTERERAVTSSTQYYQPN
jgi:hypothetical protein